MTNEPKPVKSLGKSKNTALVESYTNVNTVIISRIWGSRRRPENTQVTNEPKPIKTLGKSNNPALVERYKKVKVLSLLGLGVPAETEKHKSDQCTQILSKPW